MRKIAFVLAVFLSATPVAAMDPAPTEDPVTVAQVGPMVIRAPRVVTEPTQPQPQPRTRNAQRQPQHQQWDQQQQQPAAQPQQQAQYYYSPPQYQQQPPSRYQQYQQPQYQQQYQQQQYQQQRYQAQQYQQQQYQQQRYQAQQYQQQQYQAQQPRGDLGGGFLEFLVTGNGARQPQQQQYYQQPQQQQPQYYSREPMYYERQAPAYQQPMHLARTDPREQPQRPQFDPRFERTEVEYKSDQPVGSIVIDTRTRYLYLIQPNGRAIRYGVGVGRPGFEWKGVKTVSAMKEWPDWRPPAEMRQRQPYLPEHMPGGPENPLGARAIYLGSTLYRIHGSNEPHTIGSAVSSGCFRMRNQDVIDLYTRVKVGARVIVL
jgi:lipoprotein-anchoring transpeptidase ErfK/SrfK